MPPTHKILLINPNTTQSMTDALIPLIDKLGLLSTTFTTFTAPSGVPSINNESDAAISASACLPSLKTLLEKYDGFVVCCYSHHPLVSQLRDEIASAGLPGKVVAGIFEASVATCLQILSINQKFGIVSTGSQWSDILDEAVAGYLGSESSKRYAGTETTGLNADELHTTPKDQVDQRMKEATKRLLGRGGVKGVCLGCAGMAGMDVIVRSACVEALGEDGGKRVGIVDGVISAVLFVDGALRAGL